MRRSTVAYAALASLSTLGIILAFAVLQQSGALTFAVLQRLEMPARTAADFVARLKTAAWNNPEFVMRSMYWQLFVFTRLRDCRSRKISL